MPCTGGAADFSHPRNLELAMPQTFTQLHYHIVFSTKNREPLITPQIQERMWSYLAGILRQEGCLPLVIGGTEDHVHVSTTIPQTFAIANVVRQMKSRSSIWAHGTLNLAEFWWQNGYGAFTVSHSVLPQVREYIETQEERHKGRSFQDEFRALLRWHDLDPDEEHMWD
jgi:putative transposase